MMAGVVLSVILIMALILGVYIFGVYTASREDSEMHIEKENKDKNVIIEIFFEVIFSFMFLFELIGFKQEQTGIAVSIIVVFTIIFCTNKIINEIRKINR